MFTFLVTQSLRNRLLVLALALVLVVYGAFTVHAAAGRRVPRPQPADRHHHDRGRRAGAARGRAARHLSDRDADERRAGRDARALGLRASACRSSMSSSTGAPTSTATASRSPSGWRWCASSCPPNIAAADGADQLDHGPDPADRGHQRPRNADGGARDVADFAIRPRLLTIPGVAQVIPIGRRGAPVSASRRNPPALRALGVTYEQVEKALAQFGANTGGGFTDQYSREYLIRNIGRTTSLDDLRNVVVATDQRRPIYLRQVATRRVRAQGQARRRRLHGQAGGHRLGREAAQRRHRPADARDRAGACRSSTATLPKGIKADQILFRQANFIETSIHNVAARAGRGGHRGRGRPVRLPAELAHDRDLADRHSGLDPRHRDRLPFRSACRSTR